MLVFCCEDIIKLLNDKGVEHTFRSPKNKPYLYRSEKTTAKSLFKEEYNENFYFYNKVGYIHRKDVSFYDKESTPVVIASKHKKLLNRDLFCLISTEKLYRNIPVIQKTFQDLDIFNLY